MVKELGILIFLGINAWIDIRKKEISLLLTAVFAAAGFIWSVNIGRSLSEAAVPIVTGGIFLAVSFAAQGALGTGDGWILLALGMLLDTGEFLTVLCLGTLLAGCCSLVLLVLLKKSRSTEIPFVPFLLAGYVGGMLLW